jgi:hypothetical protein
MALDLADACADQRPVRPMSRCGCGRSRSLAGPGPWAHTGDPRDAAALHSTLGDPGGRPHVFALTARAIPLSSGGGSLREQGIDVALLMTPRVEEPFALRAPRGAIGAGRQFVLRCAGLERGRGALAQAMAVAEMGMHFDLVTAEIVRPNVSACQGVATTAASGTPRDVRGPTILPPSAKPSHDTLLERGAERARLSRRASASAVIIDGVTTIGIDVSATLTTPVQMGERVKILVPRGEIGRGTYFALRYFDSAGAKRAIVRADGVGAQAGMLDEIDAELIRLPTAAEERGSYRAPFEYYFSADVNGQNGARSVRGSITNLSASGIGFRVTSNLAAGETLCIADPSLPDLDGAVLLVVRRDPRDRQRYGARFVVPDRGAATLSAILGLEQAERAHRRRMQVDEIRRNRGATAAPLTAADIEALRNRRMRTRDDPG